MGAPYAAMVGLPYIGTTNGGYVHRNASTGNQEVKKSNLAASTNPGVDDDVTLGYSVGSTWINTTAGTVWFCVDATDGAASWKTTSSSGTPGGTATQLQYMVNATTFGGVTGSSWNGSLLTLPATTVSGTCTATTFSGGGVTSGADPGHTHTAYLTAQTSHADVVVDGDFTSQGIMLRGASSGTYSILTDNSTNWNTAYGWGNHASAGYAAAHSHPYLSSTVPGIGTELQYRATSSTLGAVTGSSWDATTLTLPKTTFSGVATFTAGAVGAPALTFTGSLTTGIYSPGADQVAITTAGVSRVYVGATGNVGIGTAGPDAKLDVLSLTEQLRLTYADGTIYSSFTVGSGGVLTIAATGTAVSISNAVSISANLDGMLTFYRTGANTISLQIDATRSYWYNNSTSAVLWAYEHTGNFGIGVGTTVSARLHVISTTEQLRLGYNATNYLSVTLDSSANATFNLTAGSGTPEFSFADGVQFETTAYFDAEYDNGNSGATKTITWANGNKQKVAVSEATALTLTDPAGPTNCQLKLNYAGVYTPTFSTAIKWAAATVPTWTKVNGKTDIVTLYWDGVAWWGSAILNFTT